MNNEHAHPNVNTTEPVAPVKPKFWNRRRVLFWIGSLIVCSVLVLALLTPAVRQVREPARRGQCANNMRQIVLALHYYAEHHGSLPPAYTVDENGQPLHSWRTLLLPYLEQNQLYESIDLTKPWDDPVNAQARETRLHVYQCPSVRRERGYTTYLGNAWEEGVFGIDGRSRKLQDIKDGLSNTIAVLDVPFELAVEWMSPHDAAPETLMKIAEMKLSHPGYMNLAMADGAVPGSVRFTKPSDRETQLEDIRKYMERLKPLMTINGGEEVSLSDLD